MLDMLLWLLTETKCGERVPLYPRWGFVSLVRQIKIGRQPTKYASHASPEPEYRAVFVAIVKVIKWMLEYKGTSNVYINYLLGYLSRLMT